MLTIIGRASSINVRKVLWTCDEIGLAYERVDAGPDLPTLNPNALFPVMRDGDFVLWESNSICRYLARSRGRDDLLPTPPRTQAEVERWMDWQAGDLNNAWRYAFMGLVRKSAMHSDAALIAASVQHWNRLMTVLDQQLARAGPHVTGSAFTLADVVLGLSVERWWLAPMDKPRLGAVEAYRDRLLMRPAFRAWGANGQP
jgi:glutathione S-transferase